MTEKRYGNEHFARDRKPRIKNFDAEAEKWRGPVTQKADTEKPQDFWQKISNIVRHLFTGRPQ